MSRGYDQLAWVDYPETLTPISAANLNRMENGIANLYSDRNKLESNMAYVEDGDTSSRHYDVDAYLMHNGVFYKVTEEINIGDTLDYGLDGNIAHVDISSQFSSTGCVELTQAQYDALPEEDKMADIIYLITDAPDNRADLDEVFGDFATVEYTSTASKAYAVGDYLVYDNMFYLVTDDIAQGDTIVPGTNVVKTTVGDEIKSIRNTSDSSYCKMPDGTLIEWGVESVKTLTAQGPLGYFGATTVQFSPVFSSEPMVTATASGNPGYVTASVYGVAVDTMHVGISSDTSNVTVRVYWHAIGRWK